MRVMPFGTGPRPARLPVLVITGGDGFRRVAPVGQFEHLEPDVVDAVAQRQHRRHVVVGHPVVVIDDREVVADGDLRGPVDLVAEHPFALDDEDLHRVRCLLREMEQAPGQQRLSTGDRRDDDG